MEKYKTSLYLRLSKEDENKKESESITNQKMFLAEFVNNSEDLELISIKIDDGYSGSNFERPGFKELMEDIKNGKINCIVVKDFSRFGRDFIEVGKYLEEIFPFLNVRFISVNDNYDSLKSRENTDSLIIPFKNLINDSYLRDISLKIRSSFDVKRKKGEFIGSFATYGYLKDEKEKNKLIVDKVACKVVQDIFKYRLNGLSAEKIADKLNKDGILSPMEYKRSLGFNFSTNFKRKEKALWSTTAIFRILQNPVYIGTLEQNKTTTPNYKVKKVIVVPKEKRIIVENNHEPVISKEIFENVQKLMLQDTRISPNEKYIYLLSGFIFCAECGANLVRKNNGTKNKPYYYYICNNAKNKKGCVGASIKADIAEDILFKTLKNHIAINIDLKKAILADNFKYTNREIEKINERIREKQKELSKYQSIKLNLYEDLKIGILTEVEYKEFNFSYSNKILEIKDLIKKFENKIEILLNGASEQQLWIQYFKKHSNIKNLNRELIVNLVEKITVSKNKNIQINFKYENELKNIEKLNLSL